MSVGYKQTRNRMDDLAEDDLLEVKVVGTTKVYWITDEGKRVLGQAD